MRSVISKKKTRDKQSIAGVILVALLFLSVLGYGFQNLGNNNETSQKIIYYNNLEFKETNGFWYLQNFRGLDFLFSLSPEEIIKDDLILNDLDFYKNKPLYISSDNEKLTLEIVKNIGQITERWQYACLEECERYPRKDCSNNFIIISENKTASITKDKNCVFIQGPEEDLMNLTDRFLINTIGLN